MNNTSLLKAALLFSGFASFHAAAHFPLMSCHLAQGKVICSSVYQSILNAIEFNMSADDVVNSPRFHHQLWPKNVIEHTRDWSPQSSNS